MKTIILTYEDDDVCSMLHVKNMDDKLMDAIRKAEMSWDSTEEDLSQDYESFVLGYLMGRGYDVVLDTDYEIYRTCL